MNTEAEIYFTVREDSSTGRALLRNAAPKKSYTGILEKIFDHQVAVYRGETVTLSTPPETWEKDIPRYFYCECYKPTGITQGRGNGCPVSLDDFLNQTVYYAPPQDRNHISFLLGKVGVGKTSFINYLLTQFGHEWLSRRGIWFCRVDLEVASGSKLLNEMDALATVARKLLKVLKGYGTEIFGMDKEFTGKILELEKSLPASRPAPEEGLVQFNCQIQLIRDIVRGIRSRYNKHLILILDNMDFVCHTCDRTLFEDTKESSSIIDGVCRFANLFISLPTGLLELSANILFVIREDTYETLALAGQMSMPVNCFTDDKAAYVLDSPPWDEVLSRRCKLLDYIVEKELPHNKDKQFLTELGDLMKGDLLYKVRLDDTDVGRSLIDHLEKLTNYGLREIMRFFSTYAWIGKETGGPVVFRRLAKQYPVTLLTFILRGARLFSQLDSRFPNIFLVNADNLSHDHTYWLKKLIVDYVHLRQSRQQEVRPEHVIELFSKGGADGYSLQLIQRCLGSLSDANCSNVLWVKRKRTLAQDLNVQKIGMTVRGTHCLQEIFHRFFYLQLIVDDDSLPIPWVVADQFNFNGRDYSYLVSENPDVYHEGAIAMVKLKISRVLLFFEILKASYKNEERRYAQVFATLKGIGLPSPKFNEWSAALNTEIIRLSSHFNIDYGSIREATALKENHIKAHLREYYDR